MATAAEVAQLIVDLRGRVRQLEEQLQNNPDDQQLKALLTARAQDLAALQQKEVLLMGQQAGQAATAALAAGRGSDDASAKAPGGSPKLTTTSVTTVALADKTVTLRKRFPGIAHQDGEAVTSVFQPEALDVVTRALLRPALDMLSLSQLSTEAARVHIVGLMLLQALVLFTEPQQEAQQAQLLTVSSGDLVAEDLSISDQADKTAQLLGFEQHFRAGSFKGRVELQVVHITKQGDKLYAGAFEVKNAGRLVDHVEQAKKEAFAMWCYNALLNNYQPVWVVLTNLREVLRVTYEGHNRPGGPGQLYRQSMPCGDVRGILRCTHQYPFLMEAAGQPAVHSTSWDAAVQCFVGGLVSQGGVTAQELTQRLELHDTKTQEQLDQLAAEVQRHNKRKREEMAGVATELS